MSNELYHYGVPGMKWGVQKEDYKAMNRSQRKNQRQKYRKTPEGKVHTATAVGTMLGGPLVGVLSGLIGNKIYGPNAAVKSVQKEAAKGETFVSKNMHKKVSELTDKTTTRTESKKVAALKKRLTGTDENGKPAFLMTEKELSDFSARYEKRRTAVKNRLNKTTNEADRRRIISELNRMENDYLSVVEQDFWYSDD